MIVTMSKEHFASLDHEALLWACMKQTHDQVRGKSNEKKAHVFEQLTCGQQALFMCLVLHGHVGESTETFYSWLTLLVPEAPTWEAVKQGFRYFGDDAMLQLLTGVEEFLSARNRLSDAEWREARPRDLEEDEALASVFNQFHAKYRALLPATVARIGEFIRNRPNDFVQITE